MSEMAYQTDAEQERMHLYTRITEQAAEIERLRSLVREAMPFIEDEGEHFPDDRDHEEGRCEQCWWLHRARAAISNGGGGNAD